MKNILLVILSSVVSFVLLATLVFTIEDYIESKKPYEGIPLHVGEPAKPVEEVDLLDLPVKEPYFYLTDEERAVAEKIVMGEAGGEPYEGQLLVAQCLVNAAMKDGLQPSAIRTEYQYSGWNENPTESVKIAVSEVFDNGVKLVEEPILYFYAPDITTSNWHESLNFVIEVGGHRFFAE